MGDLPTPPPEHLHTREQIVPDGGETESVRSLDMTVHEKRSHGPRPPAFGMPSPFAACIALLLSTAVPAIAQDRVELGGQVRPRFEAVDQERSAVQAGSRAFTSMRVQAHLDGHRSDALRAFVQIQDVRIWGEERSTLGDDRADALDLHQGFLQVGDDTDTFRWLRIGRQEVSFGEERLVGAVDWSQQGRSFDGVRLAAGWRSLGLDLFAFQLSDAAAGPARADAALLGAYGVLELRDDSTVDLFGLIHRVEGETRIREHTFGGRYSSSGPGLWRHRVEGALQIGSRAGAQLSAGQIGVRVGRSLGPDGARLALWYDFLTGDDVAGDGRDEAFSTLFATNHGFYGHADLFLDIPAHTGRRGLQDLALKLELTPAPDLAMGVDFHHFRLARGQASLPGHLGEELDVDLTYRYLPGLSIQGGTALVWAGPGLIALDRLSDDLAFGYLMLNATF